MTTALEELMYHAVSDSTDWSSFGKIKAAYHSELPLVLLSYSSYMESNHEWNKYELLCRGLILRTNYAQVVARPFDKFFNWGEKGRYSDSRIIRITEKIDGSLGIGFFFEGKFHIATRGSFISSQARWATKWINERLRIDEFSKYQQGWTYLFEILYHENQVVIDYSKEHLVLLDIRDNETGIYKDLLYVAGILDLETPKTLDVEHVDQLITMVEWLKESEGFVAEFADGQRFKFKTQWYLDRHHLFTTRFNIQSVFEAIRDGFIDDYIHKFTGEKYTQLNQWVNKINWNYNSIYHACMNIYTVCSEVEISQKEFALTIQHHSKEVQSILFAMRANKEYNHLIWKLVEKKLNVLI